jgi:cytochrome c-type biogenesis protein CcmH
MTMKTPMKPPMKPPMKKHRIIAIGKVASVIGVLLMLSASGWAVTPDEVLQDAKLEARAREIGRTLRCLVCQNQSIDDSDAPLAHDLRVLLRERLTAGNTDAQAIGFMVARYGNFILLKPPVQADTLALWFGPALLLIIAAIGFGRYVGRGAAAVSSATAPLAPDEQERLDVLLRGRRST